MTIKTRYKYTVKYHNDPKYSDRQVRANSVEPDQMAPSGGLTRFYTICHSVYNSSGPITLQ